jgi:hypothetical protein
MKLNIPPEVFIKILNHIKDKETLSILSNIPGIEKYLSKTHLYKRTNSYLFIDNYCLKCDKKEMLMSIEPFKCAYCFLEEFFSLRISIHSSTRSGTNKK